MRFKNQKNQEKKENGLKKIIISLIIFFPLASMVVLAIQTSHQGSELIEIENEIADLKKENNEVELSVIKETSLSVLSETAFEFGFEKPNSMLYLNRQSSVAKLQ